MKKLTAIATVIIFLFGAQPAIALSYNYRLAIQYAERHVYEPNRNWPNFAYNGGDCANFVSQALHAGGIRMDTHNFVDRRNWFMVRNMHGAWIWGWSWSLAHELHEYFRTNPRTAPHRRFIGSYDFDPGTARPWPPNNNVALGNGDVISFDYEADGRMNHVVIVTRQYSTDRYVPRYTGDLVTSRSRVTATNPNPHRKNIIWHTRHRILERRPHQINTTRIFAWSLRP